MGRNSETEKVKQHTIAIKRPKGEQVQIEISIEREKEINERKGAASS